MSTKIYNGYVLDRVLSITELGEFQREMQEKITPFLYERFCQLFGRKVQKIIDDLTVLNADMKTDKKPEKIEEAICNLLFFSKNSFCFEVKQMMHNKASRKDPKMEIEQLYAHPDRYTIEEVAWNTLEKQMEMTDYLYESSPYSIAAEICVFPVSRKCLFMAFGLADEFLQELLSSDKNEEFLKKWCLKEYHYQNQTDRPEDISEEEWKEREENWAKVFINSSIPAKNGMMMKFFNCNTDIYSFYYDLQENDYKDALKYVPNADTRLKRFAMEKYIQDSMKSRFSEEQFPSVSDIIRIQAECKKNPKLDTYLEKYAFPEVTAEFLKKSIMDLVPYYYADYD